MGKGDKRRPTDERKVRENWPFKDKHDERRKEKESRKTDKVHA